MDIIKVRAIGRRSQGFPMVANEFTRPFTAKGWRAEDEQQHDIESELLEKAVATGKEVVFYSVHFVRDE